MPARLHQYLSDRKYDDYIEIFNAVISFLMLICFAVGTYTDPQNPLKNDEIPLFIKYTEIILMLIMLVDYLLFMFLSDNRILYIFCYQSWISYISLVPTALIRFKVITDIEVIAYYELQFWKVLRFNSISRMLQVFTRRNSNMGRAIFSFTYTIVQFILVSAAIMLTIENRYSF